MAKVFKTQLVVKTPTVVVSSTKNQHYVVVEVSYCC